MIANLASGGGQRVDRDPRQAAADADAPCARFDDLRQGQFLSREHVHRSRDGFADCADLDRAS